MDLNTLSLPDLRKLKEKVEREISKREAVSKKQLIKRMQQMAANEGLTMEDLLPEKAKSTVAPARKAEKVRAPKKVKAAPVAKFAHPDDRSITWSGRGRKPVWALNWINEGKSLDDLLINK